MLYLPTFELLRDHVRQVLCTKADLELATPMLEATIFQRGQPCGIEYTLLGPRSVRLSAIWETVQKRLLFFDQELTRFQTAQVQGPDPTTILDRPRERLQVKSIWKGK